MYSSLLRIIFIGFLCIGMISSAWSQKRIFTQLGIGTNYLVPTDPFQNGEVWHNIKSGAILVGGIDIEGAKWWTGIQLQGGLEQIGAGPGDLIWPGRYKPLQMSKAWWAGRGMIHFGRKFYTSPNTTLQLSPFVGLGYDWNQSFTHCSTGSTLSPDNRIPISQGTLNTVYPSSPVVATGFHFDWEARSVQPGLWIRMSCSGMWRALPLLKGAYRVWHDGGKVSPLPPWGLRGPRPGQRITDPHCGDLPLVSQPDTELLLTYPGHSFSYSIGLRMDISPE